MKRATVKQVRGWDAVVRAIIWEDEGRRNEPQSTWADQCEAVVEGDLGGKEGFGRRASSGKGD